MVNRWIYSVLLVLCWPLVIFYLLLRSRKDRAYRQRFAERFSLKLPAVSARDGIVLHTVSVGEFNAAKPLIKQLLVQYPNLPLTITCTTPTASAAIVKLMAEQRELGRKVEHCYLPFDYPVLMRLWLSFIQPQLLLILETELWPNLIANCKALAIPTLIVNARLSARSAKGYRRFSALTQPMLKNISQILTLDKHSARRFAALGAPHVEVAGNLKFELDVPKSSIQLAQSLKPLLQGRMVWVAGSTHAGEDELLIQAYQQLEPLFPELLLVLVPRHPERFDAVAELLQQQQLKFVRRSVNGLPDANTEVWLGDSMGELLGWYQLADFVFIGGSLINRGGHNPLEAMAFGKAVLSGPYVFNFQQVFQMLQQQQAYFPVTDVETLVGTVTQLIQQPELALKTGEKGLKLYQQQQGAVARIMAQVNNLLPMAEIKKLNNDNALAWFDPRFYPNFDMAYFQSDFWENQGLVTGQSKGRNTVWFIRHQDGKEAVLRHYYRGGLVGKINKDKFWPEPAAQSRAMAEFSLLWQMRLRGLPVPRPCAALYQKHGFSYSADILIERIPGTTDLANLLQQRALTSLEWQQLGALIARFHQHQVYHSDLNCHNILLDDQGQFWLIDFDKCAIRTAADFPDQSWKAQNLQRLLRSLNKEQLQLPVFHWQNDQFAALELGYQQAASQHIQSTN
ncbi:MAG: lipid IV(A) 3-deoxy-D-manno-octulosonic acid transferase [Gammaproteobacteria bacterium]|nr:lipid IV(A) 3-deoxy-D-manno-octulosonic acid transferase [Gammaproteobacteria bacterium]MBU2059019.1 lipid IV(A) 3-deoxy-D-manno-octulosonic acid transferase [Gammaproteobacteria bacterium]MBU2174782.1 lipid IV(A) 3-deoxy-D-manno-octulosonic acid transferase [Gammaproteobacteria bacterium]MBU2245771.1 lipid IV(A) 3-deoxy-D-manno-octulosonic acid transferase [Gammaproteobacteria bacterium]MBU2343253.1 lipid IV(A) 3-deoxy-D-manno-octulosonic acid transferase [Gammaproteobacteria bacterium]